MSRLGTFLLGLALGLLLAAGWNLAAPSASARRSPPIQDLLQANQAALKLDAAALAQSWAIADAARDELDAYRTSLDAQRQTLEQLLEQPAPDPAAITAQVTDISELEARLRDRELQTMLKIRALLSPEQVQQLRHMGATPKPRPH